jgi:hypothetical protein
VTTRRGPEGTLQDQLIATLRRLGFWVWAQTSGTFRRSGRTYAAAPAGTPDVRVEPYGWIETKAGKGERSPAQIAWHAKAKRHGARVATVWTLQDGVDVAVEWRRGG